MILRATRTCHPCQGIRLLSTKNDALNLESPATPATFLWITRLIHKRGWQEVARSGTWRRSPATPLSLYIPPLILLGGRCGRYLQVNAYEKYEYRAPYIKTLNRLRATRHTCHPNIRGGVR